MNGRAHVRVVVVGAGKMGAHHARVFAEAEGTVLAGVLDADASIASRVAQRFDAAVLRSMDEAIERADLVVVATPTSQHHAHAIAALAAGKHVLVEKPLAATSADAHALCEAARASGAMLLVGHSERFNAVVRAIARDVSHDEPMRVATCRTATAAPIDELCVNLAVHDIDLAAWLARAPARLVSAAGDGETAELALHAGLARVHARVARGASLRVRTMNVYNARFSYAGDLLARTLTRDGVAMELEDREPLALQAEAALAALRGEPSEIARGEDGANAVTLAERAASLVADARISAAE